MAAKIDATADYICKAKWGDVEFPPPFGREAYPEVRSCFCGNKSQFSSCNKKNWHLSRLMMLGIGAIVYNAHKWSGPCEGPALIEAAITHSALCKPSLPLSLTFPLTFFFDSCRRRTLLTWTPKVVPALNWPSSTPEAGFGLWWQGEVPRWSTGTTSPQEKDLLIKKNNVGHRRFFLIDPDIHWFKCIRKCVWTFTQILNTYKNETL